MSRKYTLFLDKYCVVLYDKRNGLCEDDLYEKNRSMQYAERLAKMIRCKTVSAYNETDLTRFYSFHEVLKELFPNVFSVSEFNDFKGSILLKWKGKNNGKPILFMNHFDVVAYAFGDGFSNVFYPTNPVLLISLGLAVGYC